MPIKVACQCGQTFAVKDNLAGKVIKCPKCATPVRIPSPQPKAAAAVVTPPLTGGLADLLDEVGLTAHHDEYQGRHCASCNAPLAHNAVLCVECGFNLETGKFVKSSVLAAARDEKKKKAEGHEGAAELLLDKAHHALREEKVEQVKNQTEGMPLWLLISTLSIIATLAISMSLMSSRAAAMEFSGWVCLAVCLSFTTIYGLRIAVIAFQEDTVVGLMYLFVPFYALYFVFTRWSKCGRLFLVCLGASAMAGIGVGMLLIAPHLSDGEEQDRDHVRLPAARRPAALAQQLNHGSAAMFQVPTVPHPRNYQEPRRDSLSC